MEATLNLPVLTSSEKRGKRSKLGGFVHSVLSFTRLEIPQIEVYQTAVTFNADTDPLFAHDEIARVFGQKAGQGNFLFRADSAIPGRFWIQSVEPWSRWPSNAATALEPKRIVVQLAHGLMYRFTLPVCAGDEYFQGGQKHLKPLLTEREVEDWFSQNAKGFGIKPLMVSVAMQRLRFKHATTPYKIEHAVLEGAFEISDPDLLKPRIIRGFGAFRRAGLGMLQLSSA